MVSLLPDPSLSSLVYTPNDVIQEVCTSFATTYAFSELGANEEKDDEGAL